MYPLLETIAGKLDKPLLITLIITSAKSDNFVAPAGSAVYALLIT